MSWGDRNEYHYLPGGQAYGLPLFSEPTAPEYHEQSPEALIKDEHKKRRRFERPNFNHLAIHCVCCALIYPFLYLSTLAARGRSLFQVRLIVGLGCLIVAVFMGISLHIFARRFMEATTWATLIEQNDISEKGRRMTLDELSELSADPASPLSAVRLFFIRHRIHVRRSWLWYAYILFAVVFVALAGCLSFALGRIIDITTLATFDYKTYDEVPIWGDGADDPNVNITFDQWNFILRQPDNALIRLQNPMPPAWRFTNPSASAPSVGNETVYFTTPYIAQLRSDGFAYGGMAADENSNTVFDEGKERRADDPEEANLLQFPQLGVRVACEKLPDASANIIPGVGTAQVRIPQALASGLYASLGLPFPEDTLRNSQPQYGPTLSPNQVFFPSAQPGNFSTPDVITTIIYEWESMLNYSVLTPDAEEGHHLAGYITDRGDSGDGWTIFDVMLLRCRTDNVRTWCNEFPLVAPYMPGLPTIGYDAIACVQRTESWVIEVRNSTRGIALTNVLRKGRTVDSYNTARSKKEGAALGNDVQRSLMSSDKVLTYYLAYVMSTYNWLAETGKLGSPTLLDQTFLDYNKTNGTLSAPLFERFRGISTATTILPLLVSNVELVSRRFHGRQAAFARIQTIPMLVAIGMLLLAGLIGCLFVPALPNGFPKRRFDMYSWMMAVKGDGLMVEEPVKPGRIAKDQDDVWKPGMTLEEVEKNFGKKRVIIKHPTRTEDSEA